MRQQDVLEYDVYQEVKRHAFFFFFGGGVKQSILQGSLLRQEANNSK